jgi:glucose/arabinose dehydrogenase
MTRATTHLAFWLGFAGSVASLAMVSCTGSEDRPPGASSGSSGHSSGSDGGSGSSGSGGSGDPGALDGGPIIDLTPDAMPPPGTYCSLPGSVVATSTGRGVVPGASVGSPDLSWVSVPAGFCAHHFANVAETRNLRVSPSGDLFVASPSYPTAGGEEKLGLAAILVLPDDNHDGLADAQLAYLSNMPSTQGITFANGYFYFQNGPVIQRVAYAPGDRTPSGAVETVTTITAQQSPDHWPKAVDVAQDGTVYVTNGSDQSEACLKNNRVAIGAIFKAQPNGQAALVSQGFRNPIAMRCESDHNVCLVAELAKDGSGDMAGREKLVPVQQGADWGFPCCATTHTPYTGMEFQDTGITVQAADCAGVTPESVSFQIGHTPFGIDFESGLLDGPWAHRVFVALHGYVGSFEGSRVVAVSLDPTTGLPLPSTDIQGLSQMPNMMDFVVGWDDGTQGHGRATAVAFGTDGRLYVGDDTKGEIFWVAPITLKLPQ